MTAVYTKMDDGAYEKARKSALKASSAAQLRGRSPHLPVLEKIVPELQALQHISLGVQSVPLDAVVGTYTEGRTSAFACNFMPLSDISSEFGMKWTHLYRSVAEEGLNQPVKLLEYMQQYYAIEGNKRISVMKYLGSPTIEADVTRVLPERKNTRENRIYFEYIDFYADTKINYIRFSREGSFARLIERTGHTPGVKWSDEDVETFGGLYSRFAREYDVLVGEIGSFTPADAFLIYMEIFGYEKQYYETSEIIRTNIRMMREEFRAQRNSDKVELKLTPEGQKPGLVNRMLHSTAGTLKVGFINTVSPEKSGWVYGHTLGKNRIDSVFGSRVKTEMRSGVAPEDCADTILEMAKQGTDVIFTTSPVLLRGAIKAAVKVPHVKILNCSLQPLYASVRSYYLRMYDAKYILGAIAGAMTPNDRVGYIADYPIYGVPASVNAFALGVQLTNPRAKVVLEWSTVKSHDPEAALREKDVRLICNRDISAPVHGSNKFGLYLEQNDQVFNLAAPVWNWGFLYEDLIRRIRNGYWDTDTNGNARALNYWWGMDSGAIDIFPTQTLPYGTRRLVSILRKDMIERRIRPFTDMMRDQQGTMRCTPGEKLGYSEIIAMDYLAENVEGEIPATNTLREDVLDFVRLQGIRESKAPDISGVEWVEPQR